MSNAAFAHQSLCVYGSARAKVSHVTDEGLIGLQMEASQQMFRFDTRMARHGGYTDRLKVHIRWVVDEVLAIMNHDS